MAAQRWCDVLCGDDKETAHAHVVYFALAVADPSRRGKAGREEEAMGEEPINGIAGFWRFDVCERPQLRRA